MNVYAPAVPPAPGDSAPPALGAGLVFFHGGGFLAGSSSELVTLEVCHESCDVQMVCSQNSAKFGKGLHKG